jgi:L-ascorbate metabolism protein UlaG (beta-lactamase superfamily)
MRLFDPRVLGARPAGLRRERIEGSTRFRDGKFHNTEPLTSTLQGESLAKRLGIVSEFFRGGPGRVPDVELPVESPLAAWSRPAETGLRCTWLGHSTVLLEIDGVRVLTDPVWGERVSPLTWAGPRRFHRAPVAVSELPELDAVLVSHDHFDHLDYPSVLELARRDVPFFTSLGVGAHLEAWGVAPSRITELDWWETALLPGGRLSFTATPSRHFSGRGAGANRTAWSSWSLRGARHSVFFSGDTGLTPEFESIRERCGVHDLVMLEVGAYHPSWGQIHLGPDNALIAHRMLGGGALLPVHWGTFDLGLHAWDDPIEKLAAGAAAAGTHLLTPRLGRAVEPSRVEQSDPWWRGLERAAPEPARVPVAEPTLT